MRFHPVHETQEAAPGAESRAAEGRHPVMWLEAASR
jgi:hypothetical protein